MMKIQKISERKKYLLILMFILVLFWSWNSFFDFDRIPVGENGFSIPVHEFPKQALLEYHQFPLWIPYYYGGMPFFAYAQNNIFNIPTLIYLVYPDLQTSLYLETLVHMLIATISIYFLAVYLRLNPKFAVISSIIFLFSAFFVQKVYHIGEEWINSYIWIPLIFLFWLKSLQTKDNIKYAILTGIFLAIQFHSGNTQIFLYTTFLVFCYFVFYLFTEKYSLTNIKKVALVSLVIITVLCGLAAIKLLPLLEFSKHSSVAGGRSFEDARGSYMEIKSFKDLLKPFIFLSTTKLDVVSVDQISIGIVGLILVGLAFIRWKSKYVIFFGLFTILLFLIASNSSFFYPLWKFWPGFRGQHHIGRILFLVPFTCAFLAGKGASNLFALIQKKVKIRLLPVIYFIIIFILLYNIGYFNVKTNYSFGNIKVMLDKNELFSYLGQDKELFRVHYIKTNTIGGTSAAIYGIPKKVQIVHGPLNIWVPEYLNEYVFGYLRYSPLKFYGMLNTKYLYSDEPLNVSGLTLVKEFSKCSECINYYGYPDEYSPYLYLNDFFLPRAYIVNNSILIDAKSQNAKQLMYMMMLENSFDPSNLVIIQKSVDDDSLNQFNVIIPLDYNGENINKFIEYVSSGGILLPDITKGEKEVLQDKILTLLKSFNNNYQKITKADISFYSPNKIIINLNGERGFLVLSEQFFMFEGWTAQINGKRKDIMRANGVNSAIHLDGEKGQLILDYLPKSFVTGSIISTITLLCIIAYFTIRLFLRKKLRDNKQKNQK